MNTQTMRERMKYKASVVVGAAVIASLVLTASANAQSRGGESRSVQAPASNQMIERRVAMLTSHLQLYSGQVVKIRAILAQEREQTMLRNNASDSRPDRAAPGPHSVQSAPPPEISAIRDRTERDIEKVLNARQLAAYRALKEGKKLPNYVPHTRQEGFSA
jgi:hypothetical protein